MIGTTEGGELFLEAGAVWCDVSAFDEALASGHQREALELYGGHLWDGSDLSDCPVFERWLDGERQRLRLQAVGAAVTLARELERDGSFVDAAQSLRQARDWAPYDETVVGPLLKLLHGLGEGAAAMREYDAYAERLADVELTPSTEMSELIGKIRPSVVGFEAAGLEAAGLELSEPQPSVLPMPQRGDAALAGVTTKPRAPWRSRGRAAAAIVVLGATLAVGTAVISNGRGDAPALDLTRLLVDIFQNKTGDPSLDPLGRMATDRVTAGLTHISFVDVVSLGTRLLSLEAVVPDADPRDRSGRLQALARANGTGMVVWGSYYLQGDSLHFLAHMTNANTGEELATIEPVGGAVDDPFAIVEQLRDRVMTRLATLTDPGLATWMRYASQPSTFEAYTQFAQGVELRRNLKQREARQYFLRAAALDSAFAMASLWATLNRIGPQVDSIHQVLNGRRGELALLDRLLLDHQLARNRRDSHGALETIRRIVELAPGSEFLYEAGRAADAARRPREVIEFLTQVDPESAGMPANYWFLLTGAYHKLGNYERELEAVDRMRELNPGSNLTLIVELRALAASGRIEELGARIRSATRLGRLTTPFWFDELRAHGYAAAAADLVDWTLEWLEDSTSDWRQNPNQSVIYGRFLGRAGRWDEAQAVLEDILKIDPQQDPWRNNAALELAFVFASQGHRDRSFEAVALTQFSNDLGVRAWVEAALGEPERAMELLRQRGHKPGSQGIHAGGYWLWSLRDYPPFQEFFGVTG